MGDVGADAPGLDFFISYNHKDQQWAEWIAWRLEEAGYTTRIQAWDITVGSNFVLEMQGAATSAERTVAVLSPNYLASKFTQSEWAAAFAKDPTGDERLLIPVRVQECDLKGADHRPLLTIQSADDWLLSLPWELLCRDNVFLVRDGHLDLVRSTPDEVSDASLLGEPKGHFQLVLNVSAPRGRSRPGHIIFDLPLAGLPSRTTALAPGENSVRRLHHQVHRLAEFRSSHSDHGN